MRTGIGKGLSSKTFADVKELSTPDFTCILGQAVARRSPQGVSSLPDHLRQGQVRRRQVVEGPKTAMPTTPRLLAETVDVQDIILEITILDNFLSGIWSFSVLERSKRLILKEFFFLKIVLKIVLS